MTLNLTVLLNYYATPPEERSGALQFEIRRGVAAFLAPRTRLISRKPEFCVAYEFWAELEPLPIAKDSPSEIALARLRALFTLLFDSGSVHHVAWEFGEDDRWDDFWGLVCDLASAAGGQKLQPVSIKLNDILKSTEIRWCGDMDAYEGLVEKWREW